MGQIVIGICGGSGSGKTTLANNVLKGIGEANAVVVSMDSYFKSNRNISFQDRCKINYDSLDAIDVDYMYEQILELKKGKSINAPIYDFTQHDRLDEYIHIDSRKVIIVEGMLLFSSEKLRDILDIKIFVDTDADVRVIRRLKRDIVERGRDIDSVINQYLTHVKPAHDKYIEPSKKYADIIAPAGGDNKAVYDMVVNNLQKLIQK